MGFEVSKKCQDSSLKPLSSEEICSRHKRSKSYPDKRVCGDGMGTSPHALHHLKLNCVGCKDMSKAKDSIDVKKNQSPTAALQSSLKQEILHLERHLQDQFAVRRALEKAMGYRSSSHYTSNENSMPKPAKELIKEIAVLELEVTYLEQYLLSLYRKAFDQRVSALSLSTIDERLRSPSISKAVLFQKVDGLDHTSKRENPRVQTSQLMLHPTPNANSMKNTGNIGIANKLKNQGVHRSHSSLSQPSVCSARTSPSMEKLTKAVRACHSQPLSLLESATTNVISLADHLGTRIADHVPETPNRLSEDVIKCIAAIYCKLAEPPLVHHALSSSPSSSLSSTSEFSSQNRGDMWSPHCRKESSFDAQLENPLQVEGLREFSGPYSGMVEVLCICRDSQRLSDVEHMLQNFKSLIQRLEKVDSREMKNEEKLAFWINIHNALVMHAYLVYGIPQNNLKRGSLLLKAAYNVGGRTVSADTIQSSILGCRTQRPGQWLRTFFSQRMKFKSGDDWQSYAIEHPEPLLHFALCSGSYSDPVVRIYTAKRVFQELEVAKEGYIQVTITISKEQKIVLPKILESFAKDSSLSSRTVGDVIQHHLPVTLLNTLQQCQQGRPQKNIEWVPHNFSFRYLLSKELAK
ncbi:uncharacterized protein LOC143875872 isoform X2 [Tasmannia lanceolata]|uniref:uncharacterized protein LOC143875872 isoform X2 n=1 Tax=Tasmannia lanceolata TaxID=3420 RepID=UPI00406371F8